MTDHRVQKFRHFIKSSGFINAQVGMSVVPIITADVFATLIL